MVGTSERRAVHVLAMGCRWSIETGAVDDEIHEATARRWARASELDQRDDSLVLEDEQHVIALVTTDEQARNAAERSAAVVRVRDPETVAYDLSREMTRRGIARLRGRHLLLHGAALSDDAGRALVLVAPSGGGKSTATLVLGRSFGYVTDESVVVTEDLLVAPYPKPPSLVIDPGDRSRKHEPPPDDLGLGATPSRPWLTCTLTLRREPGTGEPTVEPVDLLDQLVAMIPETSSLWLLPDGLDRLARVATAGGGPHELRYAEISDCAALLREHLVPAAQAGPGTTWRHHPSPVSGRGEPSTGATGRGYVRAAWDDAVEHEGRVLVLRGPEPFLLSGVGARAWLCCDEERTLDEVLAAAVTALGEHPDARRLVVDGLGELVDAGVLART